MNQNRTSMVEELKKNIRVKKEEKLNRKSLINMQKVLNNAYLIANSEDGIKANFWDAPLDYEEAFDEECYNFKIIKEHNYYLGFHGFIWGSLKLEEKLAVLIYMERVLAKIGNRIEVEFVVKDLGEPAYFVGKNGEENVYCLDFQLLDQMELNVFNANNISEEMMDKFFEANGEVIVKDVNDDGIIQPINYIEAYGMAQIVLNLNLEVELENEIKEYKKNSHFKNDKLGKMAVNSISRKDIQNLYNKLIHLKCMNKEEEDILYSFLTQSLYKEYITNNEHLKEIAIINKNEQFGLGYNDIRWELFDRTNKLQEALVDKFLQCKKENKSGVKVFEKLQEQYKKVLNNFKIKVSEKDTTLSLN